MKRWTHRLKPGTGWFAVPRIVIAGGGIVGLSTAMLLTKQGHEVTVLERDGGGVPGSPDGAWQSWDRHGVAQFRQPHYLHAAGRQVLDAALPEVTQALRDAGGTTFDMLALMPPFITDRAPRDGDDRFVTVTGRRPVIEYAVAATAGQQADIRRGVSVTELVTGPEAVPGVPHVTGVRTSDGEELAADLVIDAMGRRSGLPGWLAALGARPVAEEAEDSGFTYYTRYFQAADGKMPQFITGLLTPFDSFSLLTLPGDAGSWSVTIYISSRDQALKEIRHPEKWRAVIAACPLHAHLLDGEPVSGVLAMSGIVDRHRRTVTDGTPVVTGLVAVGDSACCTNPSLGRGMTMGLLHATGTAEVIADQLSDPAALAVEHDRMTQARVTPWYRSTVAFDRARKNEIDASIEGTHAPEPTGPAAEFQQAFQAALHDADLFRGVMEIIGMLALPEQVFARPGFAGRIGAAADGTEPFTAPGPSRADLLAMLA
jgi:2-polyprenyl-6-methoxyphenol hydroxylase-like FAD-dependent oxidoreductase